MNKKLTIVMYHYVRDLKRSRFPAIQGLSTPQFVEQIEYLEKHYQLITAEDLMSCAETGADLPPKAALLTFDDGYLDHFTEVFPVLDERNIQGCFFLPSKAILENRVLDVNKSHFILATAPDKLKIMNEIFSLLDEHRAQHQLKSNQEYFEALATDDRYDVKEIVFIKRFFQKGAPAELRKKILDLLFKKYVTADEASFAGELYMNRDQIKCMKNHGMTIGSHGHDHRWLELDDPKTQEQEVRSSLGFLKSLGCDTKRWIMSYPYGSQNDSLRSIVGREGCKAALTSRIAMADLDKDDPLLLPRLDTNDLPKERNASPNEWTLKR